MNGRPRRLARAAVAAVLAGTAVTACSTPELREAAPTGDCDIRRTVSGENPWSPGPGWNPVLFDDFDRCELGDGWSAYSGQPGGNEHSVWDPSMVTVSDGTMKLNGELTPDGWVTGGVSNHPSTQLYGRWEVRMRADLSADLSYHALLWPKNEIWPPEIDFAESVASKRDDMSVFLHWRRDDGEFAKTNTWTKGDFSKWHTVGVEWMPGVVKYLLDGEVWAEARSFTAVPTTPMWLAVQVEAGSCERRTDWGMKPCGPDEARPKSAAVEIDWVIVYRPGINIYEQQNDPELRKPTPGAIQLDVD